MFHQSYEPNHYPGCCPDSPFRRLPSWDTIQEHVQLYLRYCNYQPLPLLPENLASTITSRDPELLWAMMALTSRFDNLPSTGRGSNLPSTVNEYFSVAKDLILRRVIHGPIELSTMQALCLLSLGDFNRKCLSRYCTQIFDDVRREHSTS